MLSEEIRIRNIRALRDVRWKAPDNSVLPGWHVILGGPGSGKSTFLDAAAFALNGPPTGILPQEWLSIAEDWGYAEARGHRPDASGRPRAWKKTFDLNRRGSVGAGESAWRPCGVCIHSSAHRRRDQMRSWVQGVKRKAFRNPQTDIGALLDELSEMINCGNLFPEGIGMSWSPGGVRFFLRGNGDAPPEQSGDAGLSAVHLVLGIVARIVCSFDEEAWRRGIRASDVLRDGKVTVTGVVLIDEPELHLHPTEQNRLGCWLTTHFPNVQFIVSANSPFICWAAERGSIFHLENGTGRMVVGAERDRLIYGNVLEAYDTMSFGVVPCRSDAGMKMTGRLAELNLKEIRQALSEEEQAEQRRLRAALPTDAHCLTPDRSKPVPREIER